MFSSRWSPSSLGETWGSGVGMQGGFSRWSLFYSLGSWNKSAGGLATCAGRQSPPLEQCASEPKLSHPYSENNHTQPLVNSSWGQWEALTLSHRSHLVLPDAQKICFFSFLQGAP